MTKELLNKKGQLQKLDLNHYFFKMYPLRQTV